MNKTVCTLFHIRKSNKHSLPPLIASARNTELSDVRVCRKEISNVLEELKTEYSKVIFAESYNSLKHSQVEQEISTLHKDKNVILLAGGPHPSGDPLSTLKIGFDYVAIGEGERILTDCITRIHNNQDLNQIPGIAYLTNKGIQINAPYPPINLDDSIPFSTDPAIHPQIEIVRGCPFRCRFCQVPIIFGQPRFRSIESTKKIVDHYVDWFKTRNTVDLRFVAPNSLAFGSKSGRDVNLTFIEKFFKEISIYTQIRIFFASFPSEVRPEFLTDDVASLLSEYVSNNRIAIGGQSGSERVLQLMRRGHNVTSINEAVEISLKYDFTPSVDMLFGFPGEIEEDQWQSINLIKDIVKKGSEIRLHYFLPLPGTSAGNLVPSPISKEVLSELGALTLNEKIVGAFPTQLKYAQNLTSMSEN